MGIRAVRVQVDEEDLAVARLGKGRGEPGSQRGGAIPLREACDSNELRLVAEVIDLEKDVQSVADRLRIGIKEVAGIPGSGGVAGWDDTATAAASKTSWRLSN